MSRKAPPSSPESDFISLSLSRHIYGPVLSRRLGRSLGVDILPPKTCNLDCIYCQLGPTKKLARARRHYFRKEEILEAIRISLRRTDTVDFITFSGSGEPTLNSHLGQLIRQIKKITKIPVAVLTNSLLLTDAAVREELAAADLVVPSLDAATQEIFLKVNRPAAFVQIEKIIEGLRCFRQEFHGKIWLEIMLVKEVNDDTAHLEKLKAAVDLINPDKVQLNTVVRPPSEPWVKPVDDGELNEALKLIGPRAEVITEMRKKPALIDPKDLTSLIFNVLRRRPASSDELVGMLGATSARVNEALQALLREEKIVARWHGDRLLYQVKRGKSLCENQPT